MLLDNPSTESNQKLTPIDLDHLLKLSTDVEKNIKKAISEIKTSEWLFDVLGHVIVESPNIIPHFYGIKVTKKDWVPENFAFAFNAYGELLDVLIYKDGRIYKGDVSKFKFIPNTKHEFYFSGVVPLHPNGETFEDE